MATYFLDLDGVILRDGTNEFAEGAIAFLRKLKQDGHQVIFTTRRRWKEGDNPPEQVLDNVVSLLGAHGIEYDSIVPGLDSPRIVVNDQGAMAVSLASGTEFTAGRIRKITERDTIVKKLYDSLLVIAWTAKQFGVDEMDDYIQTVLVAESLVANNGFNHRDLVRRYRTKPGYLIQNKSVAEAGQYWQGMIRRLIEANDLDYMAAEEQGITDGCAMKVICVAPFYLQDVQEMIANTDRITRITHNFVDGRLAAQLIVLRARQILLDLDVDNPHCLKWTFIEAVEKLGLEGPGDFFLKKLTEGISVLEEIDDPFELTMELNRIMGLTKAANSAPLAACLFSFKAKNNFRDHLFLRQIPASEFRDGAARQYREHFVKMGRPPSVLPDNEIHNDKDTFSSIAFSLIALQHGLGDIEEEAKTVEYEFTDNLRVLAENVVRP